MHDFVILLLIEFYFSYCTTLNSKNSGVENCGWRGEEGGGGSRVPSPLYEALSNDVLKML